jgi:hypothetical protein
LASIKSSEFVGGTTSEGCRVVLWPPLLRALLLHFPAHLPQPHSTNGKATLTTHNNSMRSSSKFVAAAVLALAFAGGRRLSVDPPGADALSLQAPPGFFNPLSRYKVKNVAFPKFACSPSSTCTATSRRRRPAGGRARVPRGGAAQLHPKLGNAPGYPQPFMSLQSGKLLPKFVCCPGSKRVCLFSWLQSFCSPDSKVCLLFQVPKFVRFPSQLCDRYTPVNLTDLNKDGRISKPCTDPVGGCTR